MTTLTLQVDNNTLLDNLKNVLKAMKGVRIVRSVTSDEESIPNAKTLAAMHEIESGKDAGIVNINSLDDFVKSME